MYANVTIGIMFKRSPQDRVEAAKSGKKKFKVIFP